jgi:hypothetical protein
MTNDEMFCVNMINEKWYLVTFGRKIEDTAVALMKKKTLVLVEYLKSELKGEER